MGTRAPNAPCHNSASPIDRRINFFYVASTKSPGGGRGSEDAQNEISVSFQSIANSEPWWSPHEHDGKRLGIVARHMSRRTRVQGKAGLHALAGPGGHGGEPPPQDELHGYRGRWFCLVSAPAHLIGDKPVKLKMAKAVPGAFSLVQIWCNPDDKGVKRKHMDLQPSGFQMPPPPPDLPAVLPGGNSSGSWGSGDPRAGGGAHRYYSKATTEESDFMDDDDDEQSDAAARLASNALNPPGGQGPTAPKLRMGDREPPDQLATVAEATPPTSSEWSSALQQRQMLDQVLSAAGFPSTAGSNSQRPPGSHRQGGPHNPMYHMHSSPTREHPHHPSLPWDRYAYDHHGGLHAGQSQHEPPPYGRYGYPPRGAPGPHGASREGLLGRYDGGDVLGHAAPSMESVSSLTQQVQTLVRVVSSLQDQLAMERMDRASLEAMLHSRGHTAAAGDPMGALGVSSSTMREGGGGPLGAGHHHLLEREALRQREALQQAAANAGPPSGSAPSSSSSSRDGAPPEAARHEQGEAKRARTAGPHAPTPTSSNGAEDVAAQNNYTHLPPYLAGNYGSNAPPNDGGTPGQHESMRHFPYAIPPHSSQGGRQQLAAAAAMPDGMYAHTLRPQLPHQHQQGQVYPPPKYFYNRDYMR